MFDTTHIHDVFPNASRKFRVSTRDVRVRDTMQYEEDVNEISGHILNCMNLLACQSVHERRDAVIIFDCLGMWVIKYIVTEFRN